MNEALTIEAVEGQFAKWRATKQAHEAIPDSLWEQIGILLKSYRTGEILLRLRLCHSQLKAKGLIPSANKQRLLAPTNTFVEVPPSPTLMTLPTSTPQPMLVTTSVTSATPTPSVPTPSLTLTRGEVTLTLSQPTDAHVHTIMACLCGAPC